MKNFAISALLVSALATPLTANAVGLLTQADGTFGTLAMNRNDDGSSNLLNLPFAINFYGNTFEKFFVNNNGNISFNSQIGSYTPRAFPVASQPMIAPWWADVDTRCATCGQVYVGSVNADTVIVTWNNVGYFSNKSDKLNNFQLALRNQSNGNFDIEFRYDRLEWTTGSASGGSNGLGGTPAQAGFDAGDQVNYFTLPGSRTADVLQLVNLTNVVGGDPGFWSFAIRNGLTPGSTPDNPLLPVVLDGSFTFDFNVQPNQMVYVDPEVAVGYDYEVTSGPNFASVLLPTNIGDGEYDLYLWDSTQYVFLTSLTGGSSYNFGPNGVNRFRVLGIETSAALDPTNTTAFVTGLSFVAGGNVSMSQTPIVSQVPLPAAGVFMLSGLIGLSGFKVRTRRLAA